MKPLIVANWKCNPASLKEALSLFDKIEEEAGKNKKIEIVVCPPHPLLSVLQSKSPNLFLGAQDCFWEKSGPYTGAVSANILKDIKCKYVILGHSERRRIFGEIDEVINKKIKTALSAGLEPIFCVGETQDERNTGETLDVLKLQVEKGLEKISKNDIKNIVIAYEPVWAIGTGKVCPPEEAQTMGLYLRKIIANVYGRSISNTIKILYGGSVTSENAVSFIAEARMQGLLIGGASLNTSEFSKIIRNISKSI